MRPGEKIELVGQSTIRVVDVRAEPLRRMSDDLTYGFDEVRREGFADHPIYSWPSEWVQFFCAFHKGCSPESIITRIEFEYMDAVA